MVTLRADALVAIFTWHVVKENTMWHVPGSMLRVRERIQIHDRCADSCRDMNGSRIIRDQQRGSCEQGRQSGKIECADQRARADAHLCLNPIDQFSLRLGSSEHHFIAEFLNEPPGDGGKSFRRVSS
jgi:hypothetical protein